MSAEQNYVGTAIILAGNTGPVSFTPPVPPGFRLHVKTFGVATTSVQASNVFLFALPSGSGPQAIVTFGGGTTVAGITNVEPLGTGPLDWLAPIGETPAIALFPGVPTGDDVVAAITGTLELP